MASIFGCGFECGVAHFATSGSGAFATTEVARSGNRSGRITGSTTTSGYFQSSTILSGTIYVLRFYIYFNSLPTQNCMLNVFNTAQAGAGFNASDSKIYPAYNNAGITFGTTGLTVTTGQWYRIDTRVNITSNPWLIDVQVDGTALTQLSRATAAPGASGFFQLGHLSVANGNFDHCIDDILVSITTGDYPFGAGYIHPFVPTADGTHNIAGTNDFEFSNTGTDILNATTTAYTLLDDVPIKTGNATEYINLIAPPNATDYVEVIFGPAPGISVPTSAPRSVEAIIARAKGTGTGTNNLRVALNDNGTTDDIFNGDTTTASPTITHSRKHYTDPPSAATSWTVSAGNGNFNNVRLRCYSSDAAPDPWLAGAMIEAEFSGVAPVTFTPLDPMGSMGFFGV